MSLAAAADYVSRNRVTDAELRGYHSKEAEHQIRSILDYQNRVGEMLVRGALDGDTLPWPKTHGQFRFRPAEVTLWHGINGHGKSAVTTQVALWLALHGRKSCLASFEMAPERTILRMLTQAIGNPRPSTELVNEFFIGLCRRLWIYDHRGRVNQNLLFSAIRYCAEVKGCSHFFVDSLMKCVPREDDYGGQSDFINALCDVAHETSCHIHIVHHVRKGDDEKRVPGKFDARGAGAITDQVDNVLAVWRNKAKEREREEAARLGTALNDETPDFLLICDKQRNGEWEGNWALWGDPKTSHFRETAKQPWTRGYKLPAYDAVQEEPGANG